MIKIVFIFVSAVFILSCSGEQERFEKIDKLRGLGAEVSPLVSLMSAESVAVKIYAAVPLGEEITAEVFNDEVSIAAPQSESITIGTSSYTDYSRFRVYELNITATIPNVAVVNADGEGQFRYAVKLTSGSEVEKIIGSVLVVSDPASEKLSWTNPTITVSKPLTTFFKNADNDISATTTDSNSEDLKIGWLVSDGEVKKRRAKETQWTSGNEDNQVIIATIRGLKSRGFSMQIVDLTAN